MEMKGVYYEKSSDCNVGNVGIFDRRSWNFEFIFFSFAWGRSGAKLLISYLWWHYCADRGRCWRGRCNS